MTSLLESVQAITSIWQEQFEDEIPPLETYEIYELTAHIPAREVIYALERETDTLALSALVAITAVCGHDAALPVLYQLHWQPVTDEWLIIMTDWALSYLDGNRYRWVRLWEALCAAIPQFIQPYPPRQMELGL